MGVDLTRVSQPYYVQTILTELSYSEHWPAVLAAVGGAVDAPDPRVWRKVRAFFFKIVIGGGGIGQ